MKKIIPLLITIFLQFSAKASGFSDSSLLITLNQQIDNYVVAKDTAALSKLYAGDFVFSHGSGNIDNKQSWLKSVAKGSYVSRQHDSVKVEMHADLAILRGKLSVHKNANNKSDRYHLKYVRVYAYRDKQWQMISHITTAEYHEPSVID